MRLPGVKRTTFDVDVVEGLQGEVGAGVSTLDAVDVGTGAAADFVYDAVFCVEFGAVGKYMVKSIF